MGVENLAGTLYLDSNIIIYLVEQEPRYYPVLSSLLARANSGQIQLVSSELAIWNVSSYPYAIRTPSLLMTITTFYWLPTYDSFQ